MLRFSEKLLVLILFCGFFLEARAQHTLSGQVRSAADGLPIPLVHVRAPDAAAVADTAGYFSIQSAETAFQISAVGYLTHDFILKGDERFLTFYLIPEATLLQEVVVEAQMPTHPLREPAAVQLIRAKEISRDQGLIITDVLNRVPGVYMQSGTFSTNRITIRGIGARSPFGTAKIRAYLDDIPLTNGVGETTLEDLDLSLIQSIEVWKGPSASSLGAGLGGVIVLHPFYENGNLPASFGSFQQQVGAYGTQRQVAQAFLSEPETPLQFQLNYSRLQSDGYRANNQLQRESMTALGNITAGKGHRLTAILHYTNSDAQIPSSINRKDFEEDPRRAAANWAAVQGYEAYERVLAGISHQIDWWKGPGGKTISSALSLFTSTRKNYESRPFNILREQDQTLGVRAKLEYRKGSLRSAPNFVAGVEYFNEQYDWTTNATRRGVLDTLLSDNQEVRQYVNYFAAYQADFYDRWTFTAGTNLNITEYVLTDFYPRDLKDISGTRHFEPVWSPRVSLGYRMRPQASLFATLGHGFAAPTLEETLAPQGTINPNIRPEKGWNIEMGSKGNHLNGRLSYAWSVYALFVRDLLVARRTAEDAYIGINAGKTLHKGMEAALQYAILQGSWKLDAGVNYALAKYTFQEFRDDQGGDFSGNQLTGVPPHHLTATLDLETVFGGYARVAYEFTDAFPIKDDNSLYSDAYHLLQVKAGYRLTLKSWTLEGYAGVQNLTNTRYASMIQVNASAFGTQLPRFYYPGLPRNVYAGVSVKRALR